jgi:hypothetical protein
MRTMCLALLMTGCVGGGEERGREDDSFHVALVRWQAKLDDGTDAGSGCVLTNNKDSYGEALVVSAEPGATVELSETFERFRTTSEAWSAHPNDDPYWCGKSGAERWVSIRNPNCFEPFDPDAAPARCGQSSFKFVQTQALPPADYPEDPYIRDADGFRLTVELGSRGEQCLQDCDRGQRIEFVVE